MQVKVRTFAVGALLALLLVPAAAGAKEAAVGGPLTLAGKGFFGGEVELAMGDDQRPLRIAGRVGFVGFLDLGGDLKVRCVGRGKVVTRETEHGTVVLCKGRYGQAVALGSHFKLRGFARRVVIHLPEGSTATLKGRIARCEGDTCGDAENADESGAGTVEARSERQEKPSERRRARQERRGERGDEQQESGKQQQEPSPTIAEVAAALAAL